MSCLFPLLSAVMFNSLLSLLCLSKFYQLFLILHIVVLIIQLRCGKGEIMLNYGKLGFNDGSGLCVEQESHCKSTIRALCIIREALNK